MTGLALRIVDGDRDLLFQVAKASALKGKRKAEAHMNGLRLRVCFARTRALMVSP
jgi:hypothetical protein